MSENPPKPSTEQLEQEIQSREMTAAKDAKDLKKLASDWQQIAREKQVNSFMSKLGKGGRALVFGAALANLFPADIGQESKNTISEAQHTEDSEKPHNRPTPEHEDTAHGSLDLLVGLEISSDTLRLLGHESRAIEKGEAFRPDAILEANLHHKAELIASMASRLNPVAERIVERAPKRFITEDRKFLTSLNTENSEEVYATLGFDKIVERFVDHQKNNSEKPATQESLIRFIDSILSEQKAALSKPDSNGSTGWEKIRSFYRLDAATIAHIEESAATRSGASFVETMKKNMFPNEKPEVQDKLFRFLLAQKGGLELLMAIPDEEHLQYTSRLLPFENPPLQTRPATPNTRDLKGMIEISYLQYIEELCRTFAPDASETADAASPKQ